MIEWLEISADYRCNNRCLGCFSVSDAGPRMPTGEVFQVLARGRADGARFFWMGGGEPTMRGDLLHILREARRLGYERIRLQTNGMMLAYPKLVRAAIDAGLTEVSFSIKGANDTTHDALTKTPGCFDLMLRAIELLRAAGQRIEGDVLVYRQNAAELPELVRFFHARGLTRFFVWLLAATDVDAPEVRAAVPRIAEVMPHLVAAMDLGLSPAPDFITSLHTPPCTVPVTHHRALFFAPDLRMVVANPGGHSFPLESSPIEGGLFTPRCAACSMRTRCGGLRESYAKRFGDDEFQALR